MKDSKLVPPKLPKTHNQYSSTIKDGVLCITTVAAVVVYLAIKLILIYGMYYTLYLDRHQTQTATAYLPPNEALCRASEVGDLKKMSRLLNEGVDIDCANKDKLNPLMIAAKAGNVNALKFLLGKGAKINALNSKKVTALCMACCENRTEAALLLLESGAECNLDSPHTPLMYASWYGNNPLLQQLLNHGANISVCSDKGTALSWAAKKGHSSTVALLVSKGADLYKVGTRDEPDDNWTWPLMQWAALNGDNTTIKLLLQHGMDVDIASSDGLTALFLAARTNHKKTMELLLSYGAKIDACWKTKGYTPLMYAIWWEQPQAAKYLIKRGANVNVRANRKITPLMLAAQHADNIIIPSLIEARAVINDQDENGETALMYACELGLIAENVHSLVEAKADVNELDSSGANALMYAGNVGNSEAVAYLKNKGSILTDVYIVPHPKRPDPLPAAKQWALCTNSLHKQIRRYDFQYLGFTEKDCDVVKLSKGVLKDSWDVSNKNDLLKQLEWLKTRGHRIKHQKKGKYFAEMSEAEFEKYINSPRRWITSKDEMVATRKNYLKWKERSSLAWDLCRYVNLVEVGFDAHLLKEGESWNLIMPIAKQIQENFNSWDEMDQNYLDGREIWAQQDNLPFITPLKKLFEIAACIYESKGSWNNLKKITLS